MFSSKEDILNITYIEPANSMTYGLCPIKRIVSLTNGCSNNLSCLHFVKKYPVVENPKTPMVKLVNDFKKKFFLTFVLIFVNMNYFILIRDIFKRSFLKSLINYHYKIYIYRS